MSSRFRRGGAVYTKDGRRYTVDAVEDGIVYCVSTSGAETEFAEASLMNEAEWTSKTGDKKESLYGRLKQARAYGPYTGKLEKAAAEQLLIKVERLFPGILDFAAFLVASKALTESNNRDFIQELSIAKSREYFDAAAPQSRASLLAGILGAAPDLLVNASRLGDNLMRAMIEKGLAACPLSFEEFRGRRRN
jgi:hypothetical protein